MTLHCTIERLAGDARGPLTGHAVMELVASEQDLSVCTEPTLALRWQRSPGVAWSFWIFDGYVYGAATDHVALARLARIARTLDAQLTLADGRRVDVSQNAPGFVVRNAARSDRGASPDTDADVEVDDVLSRFERAAASDATLASYRDRDIWQDRRTRLLVIAALLPGTLWLIWKGQCRLLLPDSQAGALYNAGVALLYVAVSRRWIGSPLRVASAPGWRLGGPALKAGCSLVGLLGGLALFIIPIVVSDRGPPILKPLGILVVIWALARLTAER